MVNCNEDKGNPSTADRSHQLALTHLRQCTTPSMSLLQHPVIKSTVEQAVVYSTLPQEYSTLTFGGRGVAR